MFRDKRVIVRSNPLRSPKTYCSEEERAMIDEVWRERCVSARLLFYKRKRSNLRVVPINEDIAMKAGEYKVKAIPIADALIAASAHFIDAPVVTDDEHFEKVNARVLKFRRQSSK